jgi:hypothetical protein
MKKYKIILPFLFTCFSGGLFAQDSTGTVVILKTHLAVFGSWIIKQ